MKKIFALGIITWFFAFCSQKVMAQNEVPPPPPPPPAAPEAPMPPGKKMETQEIIIRKKGDKDKTLVLSFNDNKVMVNGKPLVEFNDDEISINNHKIVIGKKLEKNIDDIMRDFDIQMNGNFNFDDKELNNMFGSSNGSAAFLGVAFKNEKEGAKITSVDKESPAEKAGLQKDDIITKIGDEKISDDNNLAKAIGKQKPNDEVKITYLRNGKQKTVKTKLGEKNYSMVKSFSFNDGPRTRVITVPGYRSPNPLENEDFNRENYFDDKEVWGNFDFNRRQKLGLKIQDTEESSGVKVLNVEENSAAAKAGLQKDDIITEIDGNKINNTDVARDQLRISEEKASYNIKALRNGTVMNFTLKIPKKIKTADL